MPWLSTPRRSAWTRQEDMIVACGDETPWAMSRDLAKALAFQGSILMVCCAAWVGSVEAILVGMEEIIENSSSTERLIRD